MADNLSKLQRSYAMSRIRSRDNASTELKFIEILRSNRISGWRRHARIPSRPDIIFRKERIAIFLDGCFWHGCPRCRLTPKSNTVYWDRKIKGNRRRDVQASKLLEHKGWIVVRLWEHSLKTPRRRVAILRRVLAEMRRGLP